MIDRQIDIDTDYGERERERHHVGHPQANEHVKRALILKRPILLSKVGISALFQIGAYGPHFRVMPATRRES